MDALLAVGKVDEKAVGLMGIQFPSEPQQLQKKYFQEIEQKPKVDECCMCVLCGKTFSKKDKLLLHWGTHTGDKPHGCEVCGKRFTRKDKLVIHQRIHTGERPHGCEICGKRFTRKDKLVIHWRVHTGEKPYACDLCPKRFSTKDKLIIHRRIHTKDKPFACEICGKCFSRKDKMVIHRRIHTREKPHNCDMCEKTFARRDKLVHHMRVHTGDQTTNSENNKPPPMITQPIQQPTPQPRTDRSPLVEFDDKLASQMRIFAGVGGTSTVGASVDRQPVYDDKPINSHNRTQGFDRPSSDLDEKFVSHMRMLTSERLPQYDEKFMSYMRMYATTDRPQDSEKMFLSHMRMLTGERGPPHFDDRMLAHVRMFGGTEDKSFQQFHIPSLDRILSSSESEHKNL